MPRRGTNGLLVGVEQDLPRWGERSALRQQATADAGMAEVDLVATAADLARDVASALAEYQAASQRIHLVKDVRIRLQLVMDALTASVASGTGTRASEVLALQSRRDQVDLEALDATRQAADAEALVRALLGDPQVTLPPPLLLDPDSIDLARDPGVRRAQTTRRRADADRALARSQARPQVSVGLGWEREDDLSDRDDDAVMAGVGLSIPLDRTAYQANESSALERARASDAEENAARALATARVDRVRRALALVGETRTRASATRLRLQAEIDALRDQVAAGDTSVVLLLDRLDAITDIDRTLIDAEARAATAAADLWLVAPPILPEE